ncbi:MAG: hypothetical protein AB1468_03415, partial [Candidatus Micrarchaeota archaeon]
ELANRPKIEQVLAMRAYPQVNGVMEETNRRLTEDLDKEGYFEEFKKDPGLLSQTDYYRYEESRHFFGVFKPEKPGALFTHALKQIEQLKQSGVLSEKEKKEFGELEEKLGKKKEKVEQITLSSPLMLSYGMFSSLRASLDGGGEPGRRVEPMRTEPVHEELLQRKMAEDAMRGADKQWEVTERWIDQYELKQGLLRGLKVFERYLGA